MQYNNLKIKCGVFTICLYLTLLVSFAKADSKKIKTADKTIPVTWYDGYTMTDYLAESLALTSLSDIEKLAEKKWNTEVSVYKESQPDDFFSVGK